MSYDFCGWATKNDLKCGDGRIIRKDAFKSNHGRKVPLVWNHRHDSPGTILGHATLENRSEGVYAYCSFNNTSAGKDAKEAVQHGDVTALSIYANNLDQMGNEVLHGSIREVSLVLAGANPGARIESVVQHGEVMEDGETECILYTGDSIILSHSDSDDKEKPEEEKNKLTVGEALKTLNDDQKAAVGAIIEQLMNDDSDDKEKPEEEGDDDKMKHNAFSSNSIKTNVISTSYGVITHSDGNTILEDAKRMGKLSEAIEYHKEKGVLAHAIDTTGMEVATGTEKYGFNDPEMLFPDYKNLNVTPEFISRNMTWVTKVIQQVHKTPFSRIRSTYADITEDEARAKGYMKAKQKKEEFFTILKRVTTPQTIYKLQKLNRDDIIDITDFDIVEWIKLEMQMMLDEEKARAILIGDGRPSDDEFKIRPEHIRPIVTDVPLFNTIIKVPASSTNPADYIESVIDYIIRSKKYYKGSGRPTLWTTEDYTTEMLMVKDQIGRRLYKNEEELATTLRVSEIVPVEPMEGHKIIIDRGENAGEWDLIGTIVNLMDYNVGTDRGGGRDNHEQFDIDFNQYKYLIEERFSGSLVKPFSAITLVRDGSAGRSTFGISKKTE